MFPSTSLTLSSTSSSSFGGLARSNTAFSIPSMSSVVGSLQRLAGTGTSSKHDAGAAICLRLFWSAFLKDRFSYPIIILCLKNLLLFFFCSKWCSHDRWTVVVFRLLSTTPGGWSGFSLHSIKQLPPFVFFSGLTPLPLCCLLQDCCFL